MQLIPAADTELLRQVEQLYLRSFPACERKPFPLICQKQAEGLADIFVLKKDGVFCGLAITMKARDLVLLDYFAIAEMRRGMGYGGLALQALFSHFTDKRFFLEIESTFGESGNRQQRLMRKQFYLKNHLTELGLLANVFGTDMELLAYQTSLTFEEYLSVYETVYGPEKAAQVRKLP